MQHRDSDIDLVSLVRTIPDYPKPGILFRDITTLIQDGTGFRHVTDQIAARYQTRQLDKVAGVEARGLIFGATVAAFLGVGFVPVRKAGKLPHETVSETYALEYGTDTLEVHRDAIDAGERVLLVDDLLATGGTAVAAANLVRRLGGVLEEFAVVIELTGLPGRQRLLDAGIPIHALLTMSDS
ncbi:MAG: adenine phosphoribosyltransferase [Alphaproteobacteria bacterium]|nr:adenine phosphoribosyltransferase [Alphaproteobacteria bacterium]